MKLASFLIMSFLSQVPALTEAQILNFSGKDVPLKDIFRITKCQTGILFFYDTALMKDAKNVSVEWKNTRLEIGLNDVFKDQSFTWVLDDKVVTIIKRPVIDMKKLAQILAPIERTLHR